MNGGHLFSVRSGRVVAVGRAVLAIFLVASFMLGPQSASAAADRAVGILLVANLAWSLTLLGVSRGRILVYRLMRAAVAVAAVDLAVFTLLLYLTGGADSPFFNPFVVLILGATIQWGSRGAMITGLLTLVVFGPAGWDVLFGAEQDQDQAARAFVLRLGYTAVISVMLAAFGRHVERVVDELSRLSDPMTDAAQDTGPPIRECLQHALRVFGAQRGMFLWEETDEPYAFLTTFEHGRFDTASLPPGADDWVAPAAADDVFLMHPGSQTTLIRRGRSTVPGPPAPLAPVLMARARFDRALVIPATTPGLSGWILVFDHEEPANEDLAVGAMVSAQVSVALERWEQHRSRRDSIAAEDRIRLARDLHDGVLQFLAGARLQLDGMARTTLPQDAQSRLDTLRQAIADEQQELRGFISTLRPARRDTPPQQRPLGPELQQLAERLSRYWTVQVSAAVAPAELTVPQRVSYDLGRLVREAVANAVRHGGARNVKVLATAAAGRLSLRIEDDGRGFAFEGEMLADHPDGVSPTPRSLHERVRALDGQMELRSSARGATVLIDVPLGDA